MIEMKVGNFYFSKKAGLLKCIAENNDGFIVKNGNYYYYVNSQGKSLYSDNCKDKEDYNLQPEVEITNLDETIKNSDYKSNYQPKISKEKQINQLLSGFDFDKVHKVMKNLGWTWHDSVEEDAVPNHAELVIAAQRYLSEGYDSMVYCSESLLGSGGFCVHTKKLDDGEISLELKFVVESMNWSSENLVY